MKNPDKTTSTIQYPSGGSKKYRYPVDFDRKNTIIRNIEITVACVVAFIAGIGLYEVFY